MPKTQSIGRIIERIRRFVQADRSGTPRSKQRGMIRAAAYCPDL